MAHSHLPFTKLDRVIGHILSVRAPRRNYSNICRRNYIEHSLREVDFKSEK